MELAVSGNGLKTMSRGVTCLARVGSELVLQATLSRGLTLQTLNSSRSAYHSLSFAPNFFDSFNIILNPSSSSEQQQQQQQLRERSREEDGEIRCSVLLKSVCSVLRTPVAAIDRLRILLPSAEADKLQWTLECNNGVKKTYRISCNVEPEIQHLSLDRTRFPSSFVVRPRDLSRLLVNFQSSLQEITIIATEPSSAPPDMEEVIGGKALEFRSYVDPLKDSSDATLHTQLWIDPEEEFLQYKHKGDPVDITFGVKELKAFLSFCEGCEVDIHLFFEKAGEPILMAPRFGLDDICNPDFDAILVLATMLVSQLSERNNLEHTTVAQAQRDQGHQRGSQSEHARPAGSDVPSSQTKIWSELSASAAKSAEGTRERTQREGNPSSTLQDNNCQPTTENVPDEHCARECEKAQDKVVEPRANNCSQHHPSNWFVAGDDDDDEDGVELYVQTTPQYYD